MDDTLFNLKLNAKMMAKEAQRAQKDERVEKEKAKKCLEKGLVDAARVHAENAICKKNTALNFLKFSSKLDATASKIQSATRTSAMTQQFSHLLPQLEGAVRNLNIEHVGQTMSEFERVFDNIEVAGQYVGDALQSTTSVSAPRSEVDGLLSQIASEHGIEVEAQMGETPITPIVPHTVARQEESKSVAARHS